MRGSPTGVSWPEGTGVALKGLGSRFRGLGGCAWVSWLGSQSTEQGPWGRLRQVEESVIEPMLGWSPGHSGRAGALAGGRRGQGWEAPPQVSV